MNCISRLLIPCHKLQACFETKTWDRIKKATWHVFRYLACLPLAFMGNIVFLGGAVSGILFPEKMQEMTNNVANWLFHKTSTLEKIGIVGVGLVLIAVIAFPVAFFWAANITSSIALRKQCQSS